MSRRLTSSRARKYDAHIKFEREEDASTHDARLFEGSREISKAKQIDVHHFTRRIRQIEEIGNRNIARSEAISASVRF